MPDGDKVHKGLGWKYQNAYKQVCDGQYGGEALAKEVASAVMKDIEHGGDVLLQLLQDVAAQCQQTIDRRMFEHIDWQRELQRVDELAQPLYTDRRMKALAVEACKEQLQELRHSGSPANYQIELLHKYMWNVYVAQFAERVPLTPAHYREVSRAFVGEQLAMMRPYVQEQLLSYVEQIYRQDTVHLRRKPRHPSQENSAIDIDTDLFTIGV